MTVDNLILLVGTNPLPNYVVAEYFLTKETIRDIYLIYSEASRFHKGTLKEAERLQEVIRARHPDKGDLFPLKKVSLSDISNAEKISRDVHEKLLSKLPANCSIHLNYTGGTKAMGIHVYNTLKEAKGIREKTFSYLDARTYQIVYDDNCVVTEDLRETISVNFDEMIRLHGLNRLTEDKDTSEFKDTLNFFRDLIQNDKLDVFYKDYSRQYFQCKNGNLASKTKDITDEIRNGQTKIKGLLLEIFKTIPKKWRFFNEDGEYIEPDNQEIKSVLKYLDGDWFEDYVYETLKGSSHKLQFYKNWTVKNPEWLNDSRFEIDVIAIRGYQLIGLSCTTSDDNRLCKSKGFEILLRTQQIGGEEAKAILITRLPEDKVSILQDSLKADTAGSDKILILGKQDIKAERLLERFTNYIE
ncbi:MAG: hypothetical protein ACK415_05835 [Thermodesulfovibrionales bacterium]